jgi:hypothetical protein
MTRILFLSLVLIAAFSLMLAVVRARATPDDALETLLLPPPACQPPCWMGIRAGVTSADEAEAILRAHPWVTSINRTALNISWRWNGAQPPEIAADAQGLIYLRGAAAPIVSTLRIALNTQFGDVWALFGAPGSAALMRPSRSTAYLMADFEQVGVQVIAAMRCPATPGSYWAGQLSLHLGELTFTELMHNTPYSIFGQPGWWRVMESCRRLAGL